MNRSGTPPYVELHCHSAYSFLDGVSLPQELAQRAGELGHAALALTDHNSVSGSMELAQAAADHGVRAIHGAEIDCRADGPPHHAARARRARLEQPLPDHHARACAHPRACVRARAHGAVGGPAGGARPCRGPGLPDGLRRALCDRPWRRGRAHSAAAARRVRPGGPVRGAAAPVRPRRSRPQPRAGRDRAAAGGEVRGHRRRPRARTRARAELQDAFVALRHHTTLDASEPLRRGNHSHVMSTPQAMASRFADHPGGGPRDAGAGRAADVRPDAGTSATAIRGRRTRAPHAAWRSCAGRGWTSATGRTAPTDRRSGWARGARGPRAGAGAPGGGAARDRAAGPGGLLPAAPRHARAGARGRRGGARAGFGARAAGAGARAGLVGVLARVLPDRALPHRPDRQQAGAGALPARGPARAAGHRPGLPARHPRAADPARARALRRDRAALVAAFPTFRARGAIRELGKVLGLPRRRDRACGPRRGAE